MEIISSGERGNGENDVVAYSLYSRCAKGEFLRVQPYLDGTSFITHGCVYSCG